MKMKTKILVAALTAAGVVAPVQQASADKILGTLDPAKPQSVAPSSYSVTYPVAITYVGGVQPAETIAPTLTVSSANPNGVWAQTVTSDKGTTWTYSGTINNNQNTAAYTTTINGTSYAIAVSSNDPVKGFVPPAQSNAQTTPPSNGTIANNTPVTDNTIFATSSATGAVVGKGQTTANLNAQQASAQVVGIGSIISNAIVDNANSSVNPSSAQSAVGSAAGQVVVTSTAPVQSVSYGSYTVTVPNTPTPAGTTTIPATISGNGGSFNSSGINIGPISGSATYNVNTGEIIATPVYTSGFNVNGNGNVQIGCNTANNGATANLTVCGNTTTTGQTNNGALVNNGNVTVNGNTTMNGTLTVGGKTNTAGISNTGNIATNTLTVTGGSVTNGIANTGDVATGTLHVSGASSLNGATSVGGLLSTSGIANTGGLATTTLTVTGASVTNGITNTGAISTGTLATSGNAAVGGALAVTGNASVGGTLGVTGATTLGGAASIAGNTTIGGTLGVTGATTLNGATQINNTLGVTGATTLGGSGTSGNQLTVNVNGVLMSAGGATGNSVGVNSTGAQMNGGGAGLVMANGKATFGSTASGNLGAPITVTGVANGNNQYDAVNKGQLDDVEKIAKRAAAGAAAMATIPQVEQGKNFNIGVGVGGVDSETAFAVGGSARLSKDLILKGGVGFTNSTTTWGVGGGWSW